MRQNMMSLRDRAGTTPSLWVALVLVLAASLAAAADEPAAPKKAGRLFEQTAVWDVHLTFTAEQFAAMEPKGGNAGFGALFAPPGQQPGGRRPAIGPSMFVAPAFLRDGDGDRDGKLSRDEFRALAEKWFAVWDKDKAGKVDAEQLRTGISATLAAPPPGEAPPAERVNRGVGINLQGAEGKRNGLASVIGLEFEYVHASLDFQGKTIKDVAVRYKGNGTFLESRGSNKRSMKLDINHFKDSQDFAGETTLNLHNCTTDVSWMNEVLSYRLYRDAGVPAPRTAYARVYATVPGKHEKAYFGLYSLIEDVGKNFAKDRFHAGGGAIFKPVTPDLFSDLGDNWASYDQTYDPKGKLTEKQQRRVIDFARLVTRADAEQFAQKLGDYLDLDAFARYMAVTSYLATMDSILAVGQNYYLYLHPKTDKFHFIPWDLDHSFGQFPMIGSQEQREQLSIRKPWRADNRFLERVFKTEAFRKAYLARLEEFSGTVFKPARFHQQVDETAAAIRDAVKAESADKLGYFEKAVAGELVQRAAPGGMAFFRPPPVTPIKPFVTARSKSVSEQVAGKSEGKTIEAAGFGFGGGGGGQRGGPPPGFGPGTFLGPAFMSALDADKDGSLSREEAIGGFAKWFDDWDADKRGALTDEQLRTGIDRTLAAPRGTPPPPPPAGTRPSGPAAP